MSRLLLHTPEGVRDIYGNELYMKKFIEKEVSETFESFGYNEIETPSFEYFEVFGSQVGTTPSKELYKFFDKEGNTLALRPDFTPSMARCAAKYYMESTLPIRFCYLGKTFTNTSNLQGKLKEVTQAGAELMNDASVAADAEMIYMMITSLKAVGLKDFFVSLGQIDYFRGICENADLSEDIINEVRELISMKNFYGVKDYLNTCSVDNDTQDALVAIGDLFGNVEVVRGALSKVNNERSKNALTRLLEIYDLLVAYGVHEYVIFDLGMVSKFNYYTGVIFKAYTYGVGEAVAKGGRYDKLLSEFGKEAPSIGYSITVDDLLFAMQTQHLDVHEEKKNICLLYKKGITREIIEYKENFRKQGVVVELIPYEKKDEINREKYTSVVIADEKGIID